MVYFLKLFWSRNKVQCLSVLNFPGQCVTNSIMEFSLMSQCGFCCSLIPGSSRHRDLCTLFNMYNIFKLVPQSKKKRKKEKASLSYSLETCGSSSETSRERQVNKGLGRCAHTPPISPFSPNIFQVSHALCKCTLSSHMLTSTINSFPPYNMLYGNSALLLSTVIGTAIILTQCPSLRSNFCLCVEWILKHHIIEPVVSKLIFVVNSISYRSFQHALIPQTMHIYLFNRLHANRTSTLYMFYIVL